MYIQRPARPQTAVKAVPAPNLSLRRLIWVSALMAALALVVAPRAHAQSMSLENEKRVAQKKPGQREMRARPGKITITGQGTVTAAPDMGVVTTSVVTPAKTAPEALQQNTAAMNAIIDQIKTAGIEAKDIQTSGFSIQPTYERIKNGDQYSSKINGYEVRNGVTIRVRDLEKLGPVITAVVESGSNEVGGISFQISDADEKRNEARKMAVADAKAKAELYAEALGFQLGRVRTITEGGAQGPRPYAKAAMGMVMAEAAPMPVEAGEQSISSTVSIVWELDQ
ncbi:MAG: SIMPL domain-containing protein [Rhodobacteraceae bacterium]|nr:SIMPL domain-containing protein [Paracoccaceae bacterium]